MGIHTVMQCFLFKHSISLLFIDKNIKTTQINSVDSRKVGEKIG